MFLLWMADILYSYIDKSSQKDWIVLNMNYADLKQHSHDQTSLMELISTSIL